MTAARARPRVARALQFGVVSAGSMALTQVLLVVLQTGGLSPAPANAAAVTAAALPTFAVSRRWVWQLHGPDERGRQVLLFWLSAVAGLLLSTVLVAALVPGGAPRLVTNAVNVAAFACIWVAKYLFLDTVVFATRG